MKLRALDVAPGTQPPDGVHARTHRYCICTPSSSTRSVPCLQYKKTTPFCDVKYIDLFCSIRVLKGNGGAPRCKRRPALAQHACMQLCGCATRTPLREGCLWHSLRGLNISASSCVRPSCAVPGARVVAEVAAWFVRSWLDARSRCTARTPTTHRHRVGSHSLTEL